MDFSLPLKMLILTDTHGALSAANTVNKAHAEFAVDLVLHAGDISHQGLFAESFFQAAQALKLPVIFVSGNHDPAKDCAVWAQEYNAVYADQQMIDVGGIQFLGIPGCNLFSPDHRQAEMKTLLEVAFAAPDKPTILISHVPPAPWVIHNGEDRGDKAVRLLVDLRSPLLVVCGHYHESFMRTEYIGEIPVINPTAAGVIVTIAADQTIDILPLV